MDIEHGAKTPLRASLTEHDIKVLLVDDQAMIGEAVRRMLASESDIRFYYCGDPACAIKTAEEIAPTVILQDLVMPDVDGLTLVKFFRAHPRLKNTPLIVLSTKEEPTTKAEAFALGANDYLVKLPDKIELIARIRYHSKGYINLLQRDEAYQSLLASQAALAEELAHAATYVQSLLPSPLTEGPIRTEWRFIPSAQLGGDAFGYHWLDNDHFCMYLLDVCGHGVGAALMSISAMNTLRSQSLPKTDFRSPGSMLAALNDAYLMERHNNNYFTIWYAVYHAPSRTLRYGGAGHPPALLLRKDSGVPTVDKLNSRGMLLGVMEGTDYEENSCTIPPGSTLFIMSDGTYEITREDDTMWSHEEFAEFMLEQHAAAKNEIDELVGFVRSMQGEGPLDDDFSILKVSFPEA